MSSFNVWELFNAKSLTDDQVIYSRSLLGANTVPPNDWFSFGLRYSWILCFIQCYIGFVLGLDRTTILLFLLISGLHQFEHLYQSEPKKDQLRRAVNAQVKAIRNDKECLVNATDLVVGDIVKITKGDLIPADGILQQTHNFSSESETIDTTRFFAFPKKFIDYSSSICFAGHKVSSGNATMRVRTVGMGTATAQIQLGFGQTKLYSTIKSFLAAIYLFVSPLCFTVCYFRGDYAPLWALFTIFPLGIINFNTARLASGQTVQHKLKRSVLRASAIETLARVDVLLIEKTGIITENKLTLDKPYTCPNITFQEIMLAGMLTSTSDQEKRDSVDEAFFRSANEQLLSKVSEHKILHFEPFDPESKTVEATTEHNGDKFYFKKGAPLFVLRDVNDSKQTPVSIEQAYEKQILDFAKLGRRSLGIARKKNDGPWKILGIIPCFDPIRANAAQTLSLARLYDLKVQFVTGDSITITRFQSTKLKHGQNVILFDQLVNNDVQDVNAFAETFSKDKTTIVQYLKAAGQLVAVTGDMFIDLRTFKHADVTIAVPGAAGAVASAADVMCTELGIHQILSTVFLSRAVLNGMHDTTIIFLSRVIHLAGCLILGFQLTLAEINLILVLQYFIDRVCNIWIANKPHRSPDIWRCSIVSGISLLIGTLITTLFTDESIFLQVLLSQICGLVSIHLGFRRAWFHRKLAISTIIAIACLSVLATSLGTLVSPTTLKSISIQVVCAIPALLTMKTTSIHQEHNSRKNQPDKP